jgi:hypothetical protein
MVAANRQARRPYDDRITISKNAILQAITEELLEAFPGSPYGVLPKLT